MMGENVLNDFTHRVENVELELKSSCERSVSMVGLV